jgi:hypothetical protein
MSDGDLALDEVIHVARELGVSVGIADHVSARHPQLFVSDTTRLRRYLEALDTAPVFRAGELCWRDPFSSRLAADPDLVRRFDYLIGSNHGFQVPDGTLFTPWTKTIPEGFAGRTDDIMDALVDNSCELVATLPIAIVAHPTLLPHALLQLESDVEAWWTEERESRLIEATLRAGVAIEISNRYRLPHPRFLVRAREAGARFTLRADSRAEARLSPVPCSLSTVNC